MWYLWPWESTPNAFPKIFGTEPARRWFACAVQGLSSRESALPLTLGSPGFLSWSRDPGLPPFHCLFTSQGEKVHQISKNAMGWDDLDDTSGVGFHLKTHMLHGAGIFTNIYPINHPNVGKYTIHGAYGKCVDTSGDHPWLGPARNGGRWEGYGGELRKSQAETRAVQSPVWLLMAIWGWVKTYYYQF